MQTEHGDAVASFKTFPTDSRSDVARATVTDLDAEVQWHQEQPYRVALEKSRALRLSAATGDVKDIEKLIADGADFRSVDDSGNTPLHLAASNGYSAAIETLVAAGTDVNAANNFMSTALHLASSNNQIAAIEALLRCGADVKAKNKIHSTPLHLAATNGHATAAEVLINKGGAEVNSSNLHRNSPLQLAACGCGEGHLTIIKMLLLMGANVNAMDYNRRTALHQAAHFRFPAAVEVLIVSGADVDALNGDGETPLQYTNDAYTSIVKALRAEGAR